MVLSRVCKNCSPVARRKQKQREDVKEEAAGPLINKAGGGREEGGGQQCLVVQLVESLLFSGCAFVFFLPKGGSLQRASRLLRPWWAQVLARSRLTLSRVAAC